MSMKHSNFDDVVILLVNDEETNRTLTSIAVSLSPNGGGCRTFPKE